MFCFVSTTNLITVYKSIMMGDFTFCKRSPVLIHMDQCSGNGVLYSSIGYFALRRSIFERIDLRIICLCLVGHVTQIELY
jgi:hypothetical protein